MASFTAARRTSSCPPSINAPVEVQFALPTVHTFCSACEKSWPFNPNPQEDLSIAAVRLFSSNPQQEFSIAAAQSMFFSPVDKCQIWILPYRCQSCKGEPLVFIVR